MDKRLLKRVAKHHGVSEHQVRREMEAAIQATFQNPDATPEQIQARNRLPRVGEIPTVEEFLEYMTSGKVL